MVAAKRLLKGRVNIDSEAGPTEIAVLADDTADPVHVAADLISQAEHDPLAAAVLVTDSAELAEARPGRSWPSRCRQTKHAERISEALAGQQSAVVLVDDVDQGIDVVNAYAAEHLEIQTADAEQVADRITNAGAIFVGPWSPVSLGDYCAGSTHVLPTGGLRLPLLGAEREELPQGGARGQLLPRRAGRGGPARRGVRRSGGPAGPRRRGDPAVRAMIAESTMPDRPRSPAAAAAGAGRRGAVRRPAARRAGAASTSTRTRTRRAKRWSPRSPRRSPEAARSMNRYPERDALALRADLARYLGHGLTADQVWAANGSNEVMLHVLQAFAGPGRIVLSFAPTYSMYPEYARNTHSRWTHLPAPRRLHRSTRTRRVAAIARAAAGRGVHRQPEQPDRHGGRPGDDRRDLPTRHRASWWSTRPTTSSPAPARPARWSCCRRIPGSR